MIPTKFWFIWPSGFRGEDFKKSANQKQELPVAAMFVNGLGQHVQSGRSSLKSAHFVMIHYQTWLPQEILVSDWPIFKNLL
jgi:hypothetical protein